MSYSGIDPIVRAWTQTHSLKLFTSFAGEERRYVYTSNSAGECFQVSIECPQNGQVGIHAWSIETLDDAEFHAEWKSTIADLRPTLDKALAKIEEWMARLRTSA